MKLKHFLSMITLSSLQTGHLTYRSSSTISKNILFNYPDSYDLFVTFFSNKECKQIATSTAKYSWKKYTKLNNYGKQHNITCTPRSWDQMHRF